MSSVELDLWPAFYCEHCSTQERGYALWFLNHGLCRLRAGDRQGSRSGLIEGADHD